MTDIFISHATENRSVAIRLRSELENRGWKVFLDTSISPGTKWCDEILWQLRNARLVLVLWSSQAAESVWVPGEAAHAHARDVYFPVRLDNTFPPALFQPVQTPTIATWAESGDRSELDHVLSAIQYRIGPLPMHGNLLPVKIDEPVTQAHLQLVHSCWRVDRNSYFGMMPYQIHVILFGHSSALMRVLSVEYRLPGYPAGHDRQCTDDRKNLFELKQLANGFSVIQAHVAVKGPADGPDQVLKLSRFINMTESGPRLREEFIERHPDLVP